MRRQRRKKANTKHRGGDVKCGRATNKHAPAKPVSLEGRWMVDVMILRACEMNHDRAVRAMLNGIALFFSMCGSRCWRLVRTNNQSGLWGFEFEGCRATSRWAETRKCVVDGRMRGRVNIERRGRGIRIVFNQIARDSCTFFCPLSMAKLHDGPDGLICPL